MKPKSHKKKANREMRIAKTLTAAEAIGVIKPMEDTYILTFGQFSLIDALIAILDQTGPASVIISSWTAADAHLEKAFEMTNAAQITDLKLIVDRSFEGRQPKYCAHMRERFGPECIRAIRSHAKFMLVANDEWQIVVRTSMNLNENPRLENIEISADPEFYEWFRAIADDIFSEVGEGNNQSNLPGIDSIPENYPYQLPLGEPIKLENTNEAKYTHASRR